jgi:hypothetical protein
MKRLLRFFVRGPGSVLIMVAIILAVSWGIHASNKRAQAEARKHQKERELGTINPTQAVNPQTTEKERVLEDKKLSPVQPSSQPALIPTSFNERGKNLGVQSLVSFYAQVNPTPEPTPPPPPPRPAPPEIWLPRGTLIPCMLQITVESSHLNTPVIGTVTQNVWENGHLIVPAGAIATCWAQAGAVRDRIEVAGKWSITYPDGKEFTLEGVACDREADANNLHFGIENGTAGLQGELIESDHWANAKAFLALLITSGTQIGTAVATSTLQAQHTTGVTALPDTTPIMAKYLDQLLNGETGDGRFVRVHSSKEFYIFTASVVFPTQRSIGAQRQLGSDRATPLAPPLSAVDRTLSETMRAIREAAETPKAAPTPTPFSY